MADEFKTVVVSNSPPDPAKAGGAGGGAWVVISDINPDVWVGPSKPAIPDDVWAGMPYSQRSDLTENSYPNYKFDVVNFGVSESLQEAQYKLISNQFLWPLAHSIDPKEKSRSSLEELSEAYYNGYLPFNSIASEALDKVVVDRNISEKDMLWIHDYQCSNVVSGSSDPSASVFTRHIPFAPLEFFEETTITSRRKFVKGEGYIDLTPDESAHISKMLESGDIISSIPGERNVIDGNGDKYIEQYDIITMNSADGSIIQVKETEVPIMDAGFFRDYIELFSSRALLTFQRSGDQANFIMLMASMYDDFAKNNPKLFEHDGRVLDINDKSAGGDRELIKENLNKHLEIGSLEHLNMSVNKEGQETGNDKVSLLNVPVGHNFDKIRKEIDSNNLDKTVFYDKEGKDFAAKRAEFFNASIGNGRTANLTCMKFEDWEDKAPTIKDIIDELNKDGERKIILSPHRNDYTKGTDTKIEVMDKFFEKNPERSDDVTFLYYLPPTRGGVEGYKEYAESVFSRINDLREKYGEKSVVVLQQGAHPQDVLGTLNHKSCVGLWGLGDKDGYDLTTDEAVISGAKGLIVSSGIGAADKLGANGKGAFVIENPRDSEEVLVALEKVLDPEMESEIEKRHEVMLDRVKQYDAKNFTDTVKNAFSKAMEFRFGEDWHKRKTEAVKQDDKPHYIKELLDRTTKLPEPLQR